MKINKSELEPITYTVGYYEGNPITETMSVDEQIDIFEAGCTPDEIIENNILCYRDWQCDC